MKLANYEPTYRWVLLEPLFEEKVGSLYIPAQSQRSNTYMVVKAGPQCEIARPGLRVIVENGPTIDLNFEENRLLYQQILEMRIIGVDNDSSGNTYQSEPTLSGDSE